MAFSSRELLLVLRARDEASRVVRGFANEFAAVDGAARRAAQNQISAGSALISVGAGIGAIGAASLAWFKGSTDAAVEFNRQVAYTATQLDGVAASQKDLGDIVKRAARDIAVPIDQLNAGLYDIFSSMEVNASQAEMLLRSFAREAVAGQVEMQEASRATIGILNAFHLKVEDVTRVQDVQFQLVRKGVGTYEEFAKVMGRASPSAARAGQTVETLSGMLAYLTRNGLSAAMAAASAGRAFDAFSHPKTVNNLKELGVNAKNARGEFRPFTEVMRDLQKALEDMTAPERAAALYELFKGSGGTIQARRFYDMVTKDKTSVEQFVALVGDMNNATGAFDDAYQTMAGTTASQSALIENQWQLLRIEAGEALIPVLLRLMNIIQMGLDWWNSLDEGLRKQIITWIAIGSAIAVALGIIVAMAGGFLMLAGAAAMAGIGIGALMGIFLGVIVGIAAIIAAIVFLRKNWDNIVKALAGAWRWFWGILKPIVDWIWDVIGDKLVALWKRMSADVIAATKAVGDWINRIWGMIIQWAKEVWPGVKAIVGPIIDWFVGVWPFVLNVIRSTLRWIVETFNAAWTLVVGVLKGAWIAISGIIEGVILVFMGIIDFLVGIFTLNWKQVWDGIRQVFLGIWVAIRGIVVGVWEAIKGIVMGALQFLGTTIANGLSAILNIFRILLDGLGRLWNQFWTWVGGIVRTIWENIKSGTKPFFDAFKKAFQAGIDAVKAVWETLGGILKAPVNFVIEFIYNKGIRWLWNKVADFVGLPLLPEVKKLASGGYIAGPGGPRDDRIPAMLSNGEYVMPADKTSRYYPVLEAMRHGRQIPGFADGGPIGEVIAWAGDVAADVKAALLDPIGFIKSKMDPKYAEAAAAVAKVPWKLITKTGPKLLAELNTKEVVGWRDEMWSWFIKNTEDPNKSVGAMISRLKGWSYAQKGKPYLWGAVGPDSYDCSGLVGNLWAAVMGKPPYRRYFTTASNFANLGFMPGPGNFTIYLGPGHMAANVGGLHVEAYGGNGVPVTVGKVGTPLSYYNRTMNLFADGGFVSMKHNKTRQMQSFLQRGWPEPYLFDTGGIWKSGTLGFNNSGRDELVFDPDRTDALLRGAGVGISNRGPVIQNFYITTQEIDPKRHAADLGFEITHGRVV